MLHQIPALFAAVPTAHPDYSNLGWLVAVCTIVSVLSAGIGAFLAKVLPAWGAWAKDSAAAESSRKESEAKIRRDAYDAVTEEFQDLLRRAETDKSSLRSQIESDRKRYDAITAAQDKRLDAQAENIRDITRGHADCLIKNEQLLAKVMVLEARLETMAVMEERGVISKNPDAVVIVDVNGIIKDWSPSATVLFHYNRLEAIGSNVGILIPAKDIARHREAIDKVIESGRPVPRGPHLFELRKREGVIFPAEVRLSSWDDNGTRTFNAIIRELSPKAVETSQKGSAILAASHESIVKAVQRVTQQADESPAASDTPAAPAAAGEGKTGGTKPVGEKPDGASEPR